ncbi:MAG TPA: adenylate/guanylate cyclase domain-containing protein [Rhizobiaceae bacterium]|nr:adenylate/guanylate cyclase domain-containing protein [Rhizobiaceae bacterium]
MNCANCGLEIESDFAFCPRCGQRQPRRCDSCGYSCAPDFAFCPKCGAQIGKLAAVPRSDAGKAPSGGQLLVPGAPDAPSPSPDGDRRTVTVLFADLSGFTELSERLDPEITRGLQNELFEELTAAVQKFDGFVDKFIGDALLALFGAPVAHEDDPERALRAAFDMVERAARLGENAKALAGTPLLLHIGINTGQVVAGGVGARTAKSYSVTGDTVNIAQRLQAMAAPGEILVGPLTQRLTRHAFSYDSLGEIALRGKSGTVLVHRLEGRLEVPRAARGLETLGLSAGIVGRDDELGRLFGLLDLACSGAAQLVHLTGGAGIGKTRLIEEFIARIRDREHFGDVAIRQAACSPLGEQSYGTLAAVLRSAYGIGSRASEDETRERLAASLDELELGGEEAERLMPLFLHVFGFGDRDGALRHLEPEQLRRQILHAIRTIFERRLDLSPLLIVLEDLHWADAVSLEALRFVMDRLERRRLMLLVTYRPTLDMDQLDSRKASHTKLRLPPLAPAQGRSLLTALFGKDWAGPAGDLQERILARAEGNPLFIEEIARGMVESGVISRAGSRWSISADDTTAVIPANIETMLLARMDRLPSDIRALVQRAAVIGPRFDADLLAMISADPARLEAGLDHLCDCEIIEEVPRTKPTRSRLYRFSQTLLHDVIYQNLLLQQRTQLHERIGTALEKCSGGDPHRLEDLSRLGHHFSLGVSRPKGALYFMAAGDRARAIYANDDALRLYRQALEILSLDEGQHDAQLELRERIADLSLLTGRRGEAHDQYRAVLAARDGGSGDRVAQARLLRKIGRLLWDSGKRDAAGAHYAEAAERLSGTSAPIEQAHLLQERGRLAFRLGDHSAAAQWADKALVHARSLAGNDDPDTRLEAARAIAEALNTKGVALARLGRGREALKEVEQSVAVAEAANLLQAACRGYTNLGVLYSFTAPTKAIEVCRRGLDVARMIGDLGMQARLLANLAVASCTFTDRCSDEGVPAAEKAIEIDRALDQREHLPVPLIALGQIHQCHGRPELASRCYTEALDLARETGEPQLLVPCYDGLATLNLDLDDLPEAERYFSLAQDVCARHGIDPASLVVLPFLD